MFDIGTGVWQMACHHSQDHGVPSFSRSWRAIILKIMACHHSQDHGVPSFSRSWRAIILKIMACHHSQDHGVPSFSRSWHAIILPMFRYRPVPFKIMACHHSAHIQIPACTIQDRGYPWPWGGATVSRLNKVGIFLPCLNSFHDEAWVKIFESVAHYQTLVYASVNVIYFAILC